MLYKTCKVVEDRDWDDLVENTYNRPYCLQQQDDCRPRGMVELTVPAEYDDEDMNDSVPEIVNDLEIGVKFDVWLSRDPRQPLQQQKNNHDLDLWWHRNFYPHLQAVANDLHKRGLLEAGEYLINIVW